jgi:hypothetical protein
VDFRDWDALQLDEVEGCTPFNHFNHGDGDIPIPTTERYISNENIDGNTLIESHAGDMVDQNIVDQTMVDQNMVDQNMVDHLLPDNVPNNPIPGELLELAKTLHRLGPEAVNNMVCTPPSTSKYTNVPFCTCSNQLRSLR